MINQIDITGHEVSRRYLLLGCWPQNLGKKTFFFSFRKLPLINFIPCKEISLLRRTYDRTLTCHSEVIVGQLNDNMASQCGCFFCLLRLNINIYIYIGIEWYILRGNNLTAICVIFSSIMYNWYFLEKLFYGYILKVEPFLTVRSKLGFVIEQILS